MSSSPLRNDVNAALHTLGVFHEPQEVVEIRLFSEAGRRVEAGYFLRDAEAALRTAIGCMNGRAEGVYFVLNRLDPALLARANNRIKRQIKTTTADGNIIERRWLYLDVDAVRAAGISSTDEEHEAAINRAQEISRNLTESGWPEGILADSGNGGSLIYRLPDAAMETLDGLVKDCVEAISARFSDAKVKIDTAVCNRARLVKLFGTVARKGDSMPDRPHRLSKILEEPEKVEAVPLALLEELAIQAPAKKVTNRNLTGTSRRPGELDDWIARSGLTVTKGPEPYNGGRRWILDVCPFNFEHKYPAILELQSGAKVYVCLHESCKANGWREFRERIEPRGYERKDWDAYQPQDNKHQPQQPKRPCEYKTYSATDLQALQLTPAAMLIEKSLPDEGLCLIVGKQRSGKTILALQQAIAVASGRHWLGMYQTYSAGQPVMILEQDDPSAERTVKGIIEVSPISTAKLPFELIAPERGHRLEFGLGFIEWLEVKIKTEGLRLVVLDSYTALRGSRKPGCDIVKAEQQDLQMVDELGKRTHCTITLIHHVSQGGNKRDWTDQSAGTYAMGMASEGIIHVARFPEGELDSNAPERLVRGRFRHGDTIELLLRFRKESLDYEQVMEGAGAALYPILKQLKTEFGTGKFSPKDVVMAIGVSRATVNRLLDRLCTSDCLMHAAYGEYQLTGS